MDAFMLFYVVGGLVFLLSLGVRQKLKVTYGRWSRVRSQTGNAGGQVARHVLDQNGLKRVVVEPVHGKLTDHYDPRSTRVRLSGANFLNPA